MIRHEPGSSSQGANSDDEMQASYAVLNEIGLSGDGSARAPHVDPTAEGAAMALSMLDGRSLDQLYFEGVADAGRNFWGAVVGGQDGHVVLHVATDDETHYALRDADDAEQEYSVIRSGGSDIDVLSRWIIPVDQAARGLWYFLLTGSLDPGVAWEPLSAIDFQP